MSVKSKILLTVLLMFVVAGGVGYYWYNKGPQNIRNSRGIPVEASALYDTYSNDSSNANTRFTGKVLSVSGIVSSYESENGKNGVLKLDTGTPGGFINCTMDEPGTKLKKEEKVTIKGICSGMGEGEPDLGIMGDVYLTRCLLDD